MSLTVNFHYCFSSGDGLLPVSHRVISCISFKYLWSWWCHIASLGHSELSRMHWLIPKKVVWNLWAQVCFPDTELLVWNNKSDVVYHWNWKVGRHVCRKAVIIIYCNIWIMYDIPYTAAFGMAVINSSCVVSKYNLTLTVINTFCAEQDGYCFANILNAYLFTYCIWFQLCNSLISIPTQLTIKSALVQSLLGA